MKELFYTGGIEFMTTLSIFLVITTSWIIYHFIRAYNSKKTKQVKFLRRLGYGKTMGLFALIVGIIGQMLGLYAMFYIVEDRTKLDLELTPEMRMYFIKVTLIVTIYGLLIYLFSLLLSFITSTVIKKKFEHNNST